MTTGDCLIHFADETSEIDPRPQLRVHKSILQDTGSKYIQYCLEQGEIYKPDEFTLPITPPASVAGSSSVASSHAHAHALTQSNLNRLAMTDPPNLRASETFLNPATPDAARFPRSAFRNHPVLGRREMSPPESLAPDEAEKPSHPFANTNSLNKEDNEITHEIWFTVPPHIKDRQIKRRYHIATRNFLALLYGKPLVGANYYDMFSDLQMVIDIYFEVNDPKNRWDSTEVIRKYVVEKKLDDVRGNTKAALGLLAWSEQPNVHWEEGYMEAFAHSVGMMSDSVMGWPQYKMLSRVTRHNLENAYGALQLRLIEAEEKLADFNFNEIWQHQQQPTTSPIWKSFEAFRGFLVDFYSQMYRQWPAKTTKSGRWVTREIAQRLQEDFGAMYDYLVDREVVWQGTEERHTRKWEIICVKDRQDVFRADLPGLPLTDMLVAFDSRHQFQHIPHPYPLVPQQQQLPKAPAPKKLFGGLRNKVKAAAAPDPKEQFQMSLAFNGATNINKFGTSFEGKYHISIILRCSFSLYIENDLVDELARYEKSLANTQLQNINPHDARLGRWILLYGILQVLSTISVDISDLKFTSGVQYFLSCNLAGCPPWSASQRASNSPTVKPTSRSSKTSSAKYLPAAQNRSYCWEAPKRWGPEYASAAAHAFSANNNPYFASALGHAIGQAYSAGVSGYELSAPDNAAAESIEPDMILPDRSELDGRSIERHFKSLRLAKHYPRAPLSPENKVLVDENGDVEGAPAPDVPLQRVRSPETAAKRRSGGIGLGWASRKKEEGTPADVPWSGETYFDDQSTPTADVR